MTDEDAELGDAGLCTGGGGGGTSPVSIDDRTEFRNYEIAVSERDRRHDVLKRLTLIADVCESVTIIRARQEWVGVYESSSCLGCRAGHIELTSPAKKIYSSFCGQRDERVKDGRVEGERKAGSRRLRCQTRRQVTATKLGPKNGPRITSALFPTVLFALNCPCTTYLCSISVSV